MVKCHNNDEETEGETIGETGGSCGSEQSCGLDFAKKQLEKHGWTEGKGLGKDESGRANTIKVGVKNNMLGVGYDVGKEFTNNWWDNLFNKAASNIVVEESKNGVQVLKKDTGNDIARPKKLLRVKGKELYFGRFIKATNDDASVPSKLENAKVLTKFSDEELFQACGGRTAHKSARHGHKLSGKLKRVAEQEDEVQPSERPKVKRKKRSKEKFSLASESTYHETRNDFFAVQSGYRGELEKLDSDTRRKYDADENLSKSSERRFEKGEMINNDCGESGCKSIRKKRVRKKAKKLVKKKKYGKSTELEHKKEYKLDNENKTVRENDFEDVTNIHDYSNSMQETDLKKNRIKSKRYKTKK